MNDVDWENEEDLALGERKDPDPRDQEPEGKWVFTREPVSKEERKRMVGKMLEVAIGQQQNVSQQQQHQQVQDHQQQQPTRVTPGYSYSTVNQALLPTAPAPQSTKPSYLWSPL